MPFTPFHFGPGLALKGIIGRRMSFSAFVAANVAIDVEPLYYMLRNDPPLHRELHTALGALALAIGLMLLWLLLRAGISRWGGRYRQRWLRGLSSSTPWAVWLGLLLGCGTHIALDSLMHVDMAPYAPFAGGNPLAGWISIAQLQWACLMAGIAGLPMVYLRSE